MTLPLLASALAPTAAAFVGSIVQGGVNRGADRRARKFTRELREQDRGWYEADRTNERDYHETRVADDRRYAREVLVDDRRYTRNNFVADRDRDRRIQVADRNDERAYLARRLQDDRAYGNEQALLDRQEYTRDRDAIQANSESLAERSAASRGIDFSRLVADAQAAGFNPMTAMSMAHAYSTHVDYSDNRQAYSNRAAFQPNGAGYNAQGGGGGGGAGTSAAPTGNAAGGGGVQAGSFSTGGAGYGGGAPSSALSSGAFVAEAVERGIDTWFNRAPEKDALSESLRNAHQLAAETNAVEDLKYNRNFGYDLTEQVPFKPAATVGVPALESENTSFRPKSAPNRRPAEFIPVTRANGEPGKLNARVASQLDLKPWHQLTAGEETELAGELQEVRNAAQSNTTNEQMFDETMQPFGRIGPPILDGISEFLDTGTRSTPPALHSRNPWRNR